MANLNSRGPAPVLPATGLHSYHADSPPFSGATEMADPEPISLDSPRQPIAGMINPMIEGGSVRTPTVSANGVGQTTSPSSLPTMQRHPTPGVPVGRSSPPVDARHAYLPLPIGHIVPISNQPYGPELSGYTSSTETIHDRPVPEDQDNAASFDTARHHRRFPNPPDDVTLSVQRSRQLVSGYLFATPTSGGDQQELVGTPSERPALSSRPSTSTSIYGDPNDPHFDDRLNGLRDGEADLDETAVQAEGEGSEAYMKKEASYDFPSHRLKRKMRDESKIPLVIVACGSFSPPTYLHLRMFEMAKDEIVESQTYEIMAGYYSPVSSYYKKAGLAPAHHRVRMCELAVEHTSTWLMVDPWEAGQSEYQRTAVVLDHFDEMLNGKDGEGGVEMSEEGGGGRRKYKIMLLAGGDLIESFGEPGVWSEPDLHVILGRFGCLIVERAGSDVWAFLLSHDILYHHRKNVIVIKQLIYNDISSTKVRLFVRRGMSIKYLLPNSVANYIIKEMLYRENERSIEGVRS